MSNIESIKLEDLAAAIQKAVVKIKAENPAAHFPPGRPIGIWLDEAERAKFANTGEQAADLELAGGTKVKPGIFPVHGGFVMGLVARDQ